MSEKQEEAPHGVSEELKDFIGLFCKITNTCLGDIKGDKIHKNSPHKISKHLQGDAIKRDKS